MRKSTLIPLSILLSAALCACEDSTTIQDNPDTECEEGKTFCKNGKLRVCKDQVWNIKTCANGCNDDGSDCEGGTVDKECDDGSVICLNDRLKTCLNGKWERKECQNGCNADGTNCEGEEDICTEGETYCTDDIKFVCQNGIFYKTQCKSGCNDTGSDCAKDTVEPECNGSEVICENNIKKICVDGAWQSTNCSDGCNKDGNDCAVPKTCDEGATVCTDKKLQKCENNAWTDSEDCKYGCNKAGTACAKCKEGTTCKNGKQTTCKDDNTTEKTCQYGCDSAGKNCEEVDQTQPTRYLMKSYHSPITPSVVAAMKKIKEKNSSRNDDVFIEIGDSHYDYDNFMTCFSDQKTSMTVTWGNHSDMKEVVSAFQKTKDSFGRDSIAAKGGRSTRDMFAQSVCGSTDCITQETNAMNPRFAFFGHGSNDMGNGSFTFYLSETYPGYQWSLQDYYRQMNKAIDQLTNAGIIPLISGIAPCFMSLSYINFLGGAPAINPKEHLRYAIPTFNAVSRGIAEARQLPWLDIYNLSYTLPDHGLQTDHTHCKYKDSYNTTCDFSDAGMQYGCNARNLYTVEMLNRAWRTVVKGEDAPDPIDEPYRGKGTQADPYIVTSIPFTHQGNTTSGESQISVYSGCSNQHEDGGEVYYKLELKEKTYLRMFAVSATGVDVDLHVMKDSIDGSKCIMRTDILAHGYLEAGTYYISVDTYGTSASGINPGQYLFGIVECMNKKNGSYSYDDYDVDEMCRAKALYDVKNP